MNGPELQAAGMAMCAVNVRRVAVTIVALVLAAGCGDDADTSATTTLEAEVTTSTATSIPFTTTSRAPSTTAATTTSTATTTTLPSTIDDVVLGADGLGVVRFGDDAEGALAALVRVLGPPDGDTGWWDPFDASSEYAWMNCPGTMARAVSWDQTLGVLFTDWDQHSDDSGASGGGAYLAGAALRRLSPITTADGVSSGDTFGRLREIYGARLWVSEERDDDGLFGFAIDEETGRFAYSGGIRGTLYWPGYLEGAEAEPPVRPDDPTLTDAYVAVFISGVDCPHT